MARLKAETQTQHRLIEADLNPLRPGFTLAEYRILLRRFLGYYAPWEEAIHSFDPALLHDRYKSPGIMADLQHLGAAPGESPGPPLCHALPPLDTRARVLGSMYVLEGATLGGQIMRRHFSEKFGFNGHGCTFFTGYGERTGTMWQQFAETLSTVSEEDSNAAVASAVATFETMHSWVCKPL